MIVRSVIWFAATRASTDTPYRWLIRNSVSPGRTTCSPPLAVAGAVYAAPGMTLNPVLVAAESASTDTPYRCAIVERVSPQATT